MMRLSTSWFIHLRLDGANALIAWRAADQDQTVTECVYLLMLNQTLNPNFVQR
jgi:hypothetical protein